MTKRQVEIKIQEIVERAKKSGVDLYKNNIDKAKPVDKICGVIKSLHPFSTEDLLCR